MHHMENLTAESELDEYEQEYEGEDEGEGEDEAAALSEEQVQEYAAELLSVSNEEEFDYFLGDLIKAAGKAISSPLGKQIGGMLKGVAKNVLPIAGSVLGNVALPGVGGVIGKQLGSAAASVFELELEGMSMEDQEFEVAKQFVRFAGDASKNAAKSSGKSSAKGAGKGQPGASPARVARQSLTEAAHKFAPGLVKDSPSASPSASDEPSGRWERRGNRIVLFGV